MSASSTYFKQLIPALDSLTDDAIDFWLEQAAVRVSASEFGSLYVQAVCYLAAHLYVIGTGSGVDGSSADGAGPVVSQSTGSVSIAFGNAGGFEGAGAYASTRYGRQYVALRKKRIVTARLV